MKTILINNEEVEVDDDSYELLEYMNINGFITLNSCSGTLKDHPDTKMKYQGYVMLDTNTKAQNMFKKLYDNNYKIYYVISNGKKEL